MTIKMTHMSVRPSINYPIIRSTAYNYPIDLKFDRMIVDISLHNRSKPDFRFLPGRAVGACLLKSSNRLRPTSLAIKLKLYRIILDLNPHNC